MLRIKLDFNSFLFFLNLYLEGSRSRAFSLSEIRNANLLTRCAAFFLSRANKLLKFQVAIKRTGDETGMTPRPKIKRPIIGVKGRKKTRKYSSTKSERKNKQSPVSFAFTRKKITISTVRTTKTTYKSARKKEEEEEKKSP